MRTAQSLHDEILSIFHGSSTQDAFRWGRHDNYGDGERETEKERERERERKKGGLCYGTKCAQRWRQHVETMMGGDWLNVARQGNSQGLFYVSQRRATRLAIIFLGIALSNELVEYVPIPKMANFPKQTQSTVPSGQNTVNS